MTMVERLASLCDRRGLVMEWLEDRKGRGAYLGLVVTKRGNRVTGACLGIWGGDFTDEHREDLALTVGTLLAPGKA